MSNVFSKIVSVSSMCPSYGRFEPDSDVYQLAQKSLVRLFALVGRLTNIWYRDRHESGLANLVYEFSVLRKYGPSSQATISLFRIA